MSNKTKAAKAIKPAAVKAAQNDLPKPAKAKPQAAGKRSKMLTRA